MNTKVQLALTGGVLAGSLLYVFVETTNNINNTRYHGNQKKEIYQIKTDEEKLGKVWKTLKDQNE